MCYLIHLHILADPEPINLYFTTAGQTIIHSVSGSPNAEWLGAGKLLDVEFAQEDGSLEVHSAEITLDGLDAAVISMALSLRLDFSPVNIYLLLMNPDTNQPIETAAMFYRGTMANVRIIAPTSDQTSSS